jgi:2-iminobutanoate/2-iminopropanoate deaminase
MREAFQPPGIPKPGGVYSQCIRKGPMVFVAGMAGQDEHGRVVGPDIESQTRRALENMKTCLEAAGASLTDVCTVTAFLEDAERDFEAYNVVYREFFPIEPPARATVQAHLLGDLIVEIQATAVTD